MTRTTLDVKRTGKCCTELFAKNESRVVEERVCPMYEQIDRQNKKYG